MQNLFILYIYLILIILGLVMIAQKLRIPNPIVLVSGGLALSLFSGFSKITIDPEMIFFIFLPPLLYQASWQISWKEFWKYRRVILSFAFPVVLITATVIAFTSTWLIPGFTLALGFLLGGIISPPDAISATSIMRQVKVPKTLISVAEGESLLNDASSLIIFRFALAAVITSRFRPDEAVISFFVVVIMGIAIGLLVALVFYGIHRWLPTTSSIDTVLTLLTPYCMYYFAERFHFSGVLAVVSGGLLLSTLRQRLLTFQSRIEGSNVWSNLVFVMNGLVFMLIGLQLPAIVRQLGNTSLAKAIFFALIISLILIITRLISTLFASAFTRFVSRFITVAESNPGWRSPLILGWAGMRGVVSLAAALSIPVMINTVQPFPYRNLILFITFVVILVTLVFQGLTLPWIIRILKPTENAAAISVTKQEIMIQKKIAGSSIEFLEQKFGSSLAENEHANNLYTRLKSELRHFEQAQMDEVPLNGNALQNFQSSYLELLQHQRELLDRLNQKLEFDEELIRKYASLIDMEEFKIREKSVNIKAEG